MILLSGIQVRRFTMQRAALNHRLRLYGPDGDSIRAKPRTRFVLLVKTGEAFK